MDKNKLEKRKIRRGRLRKRIRAKIQGTVDRPRLHVFKSNVYVYTQVIDDQAHAVLASASTLEKEFKEKSRNGKNKEACTLLGEMLAGRLKERRIESIVFDRGIYPYHGRVKALAEAMRKEGIRF